MSDLLFYVFPNENFVDLGLYQFGKEQCEPAHSFGPASRNHYLFHFVLSGTGKLMADNAKGETQIYQIKSGQGFMIFPRQITTYIADQHLPWEYVWIEFDGLYASEIIQKAGIRMKNPLYRVSDKIQGNLLMETIMELAREKTGTHFYKMSKL